MKLLKTDTWQKQERGMGMRTKRMLTLSIVLAVTCSSVSLRAQARRARIVSAGRPEEGKQVTCTGKIVDEQGRPVAKAKVGLYRLSLDSTVFSYDVELDQELTTEDDGAFRFEEDLDESHLTGQRIVFARKEGSAPGWANWRIAKDKENVQIKLGPPRTLAGTVTDESDNAIADARVSVLVLMTPKMPGDDAPRHLLGQVARKWFATHTDADGKFVFDHIPADATAELLVEKQGRATISTFDPTSYRGETLQFSAGETDIKLTMPPEATIEGIVVEKGTDKPVAGVQLMVTRGRNQPNFGMKPVVSGEDGTFVFGALTGGEHVVQLVPVREELADWVAEPVEVTAQTGQTTSDVEVEVSEGGILEVLVTEAESKEPVEEARVSIRDERNDKWHSAQTDKDGVARMRLMPGEYQVRGAYKQGYARNRREEVVTVEQGKTAHMQWQLAGQPKITGTVSDPQDRPVEGAMLKVLPTGRDETTSDATGKWEMSWDPGRWGREDTVHYLVARHKERNLASAVMLEEDAETVDIKLEPGVTFTGKVVDPNGEGIAGARILVYMNAGNWGSSISRDHEQTDSDGSFEAKGIPADQTCYIYARADGYGQKSIRPEASDIVDNRLDFGEITLPVANLSVSGLVVDVDDEPVSNARVYCYGDNQPHRDTRTDAEGRFTLEGICEGPVRISANVSGQTRLYGSVETEGGATDVKVVVSESSSTTRYVPKQPPSLVGKAMPELKDLGIELSPEDTKDRIILVCFWDMQQRPSRHFITQLAKKAAELKEKGVTVVAIQACKIDAQTLTAWVKKHDIGFHTGMIKDDADKTKFSWGVRSLPWLILTDRKHVVVAEGFTLQELEDRIQDIIKSSAKHNREAAVDAQSSAG